MEASLLISEIDDVAGALCVFFSGSPFSDFSSYSFTIDGTVYASVEHFFQIQMLRSFGLFKLAAKLSTIFDANIFRRTLRQNLRSVTQNGLFDERMFASWRATNAIRLIKKANRAKFEQNFDLKKHLVETGDRILVFTSKHDRLLGIGMDELTFLDWMRQQRWTIDQLLDQFTRQDSMVDGILGRNLLGFCLMDIRAEICGQPSVLSLWKHRTRQRNEQVTEDTESEAAASESQVPIAADIGAMNELPVAVDDSDNHLTDDHILANLSNAEASIDHDGRDECEGPPSTDSSALIYRVPNERRIILRRPENAHRSDALIDQPTTQQPDTSSGSKSIDFELETMRPADLERRKQALERLKSLRFEKPMINPFADPTAAVVESGAPRYSLPRHPVKRAPPRKIPRLCDIPPPHGPVYGRSCAITYPPLEPGEVPSPDYGLTMVPFCQPTNFHHQHFQEEPPCSGTVLANEQPQFPPSSTAGPSFADYEPGELWIPSSNPMKEVFESAKVGIKKLIENAKQNNPTNEDVSRLLSLRPPPIQSQPDARKRKCARKTSAPSYAGIFFNSKDAQMRHQSNRWVKGGRLTTTGKFEECQSDEEPNEDDEAAKIGRTLRQLEAVPACMDTENDGRPETPVKFHVVYEDTNEYADYVKWYADVHGCSPSDVVDDEYQQYLRQWYRWYRTAVKFMDVEPLSDYEEESAETSNEDKSQLLMQQWRWQQINEWELKTRNQSSTAAVQHETSSDGVSFSGKAVAYKSSV